MTKTCRCPEMLADALVIFRSANGVIANPETMPAEWREALEAAHDYHIHWWESWTNEELAVHSRSVEDADDDQEAS